MHLLCKPCPSPGLSTTVHAAPSRRRHRFSVQSDESTLSTNFTCYEVKKHSHACWTKSIRTQHQLRSLEKHSARIGGLVAHLVTIVRGGKDCDKSAGMLDLIALAHRSRFPAACRPCPACIGQDPRRLRRDTHFVFFVSSRSRTRKISGLVCDQDCLLCAPEANLKKVLSLARGSSELKPL